jgi:hypothetical protein
LPPILLPNGSADASLAPSQIFACATD